MDFILEFFFEILFQVILYGTGRVLIPALTLGIMRGEGFKSKTPAGKSYYWRGSKGLVLSTNVTIFIGLLFWVGVAIAAVVYFNR
ncbi:hypothetical protein ACO0LL_28240 [Undibacterium sp. TC4M20W]|uniref:hypothetical protein n=1 Tax=Undibacterium sp. TC4M20W TaxID=3413052 RepID=UPI003BF00580